MNKQNTIIDIDNNMVISRGEGKRGKNEEGKGNQICGDKRMKRKR